MLFYSSKLFFHGYKSLLEDKLYQEKTFLFLWTLSVILAPVPSMSDHYALTKNLCRASTEDNTLREIGGQLYNETNKAIKETIWTAYNILSETLHRFFKYSHEKGLVWALAQSSECFVAKGNILTTLIPSFLKSVGDLLPFLALYFQKLWLVSPILPLLRLKTIFKLLILSAINIKCLSSSAFGKFVLLVIDDIFQVKRYVA